MSEEFGDSTLNAVEVKQEEIDILKECVKLVDDGLRSLLLQIWEELPVNIITEDGSRRLSQLLKLLSSNVCVISDSLESQIVPILSKAEKIRKTLAAEKKDALEKAEKATTAIRTKEGAGQVSTTSRNGGPTEGDEENDREAAIKVEASSASAIEQPASALAQPGDVSAALSSKGAIVTEANGSAHQTGLSSFSSPPTPATQSQPFITGEEKGGGKKEEGKNKYGDEKEERQKEEGEKEKNIRVGQKRQRSVAKENIEGPSEEQVDPEIAAAIGRGYGTVRRRSWLVAEALDELLPAALKPSADSVRGGRSGSSTITSGARTRQKSAETGFDSRFGSRSGQGNDQSDASAGGPGAGVEVGAAKEGGREEKPLGDTRPCPSVRSFSWVGSGIDLDRVQDPEPEPEPELKRVVDRVRRTLQTDRTVDPASRIRILYANSRGQVAEDYDALGGITEIRMVCPRVFCAALALASAPSPHALASSHPPPPSPPAFPSPPSASPNPGSTKLAATTTTITGASSDPGNSTLGGSSAARFESPTDGGTSLPVEVSNEKGSTAADSAGKDSAGKRSLPVQMRSFRVVRAVVESVDFAADVSPWSPPRTQVFRQITALAVRALAYFQWRACAESPLAIAAHSALSPSSPLALSSPLSCRKSADDLIADDPQPWGRREGDEEAAWIKAQDKMKRSSERPFSAEGIVLEDMLYWLACYRSLFTKPCVASDALLYWDANFLPLPPIFRPFKLLREELRYLASKPSLAPAFHLQSAPGDIIDWRGGGGGGGGGDDGA